MEKYKRALIFRCIGNIVFAVLMIVLWRVFLVTPDNMKLDNYFSRHVGGVALTGVAMAVGWAVGKCFKTYQILDNDACERKSLKKQYDEEHEERNMLINQKASAYTIRIIIGALLIAQVVIGNHNSEVTFALYITMFAIYFVLAGLQLFFSHKY